MLLEAWSSPGWPERLLSGMSASLPLCPHSLADPLILLSFLSVSGQLKLLIAILNGGGWGWLPDRWPAHVLGEQQELPLFHIPDGPEMCGQHLANQQ